MTRYPTIAFEEQHDAQHGNERRPITQHVVLILDQEFLDAYYGKATS